MLNLHEFTGSKSTPISLMNVKDNLWGVLHFGVYSRWNANTWSFLQKMVPEDLAEDAMRWLDEKIPPEGLPIWNAEKMSQSLEPWEGDWMDEGFWLLRMWSRFKWLTWLKVIRFKWEWQEWLVVSFQVRHLNSAILSLVCMHGITNKCEYDVVFGPRCYA